MNICMVQCSPKLHFQQHSVTRMQQILNLPNTTRLISINLDIT